MSTNNHLNVGDVFGRGRDEYITFRWGFVREIIYHLDDQLSWEVWGKPLAANDVNVIAGYFSDAVFSDSGALRYVTIHLNGDAILSYEASSEAEYERISGRTEAILSDLIAGFMSRQES